MEELTWVSVVDKIISNGTLASIIGASIAGIMAIAGVYWTNSHNQKVNRERDQNEVENFRKAILAEVYYIKKEIGLLKEAVDCHLEHGNCRCSAEENMYSTIYKSNAHYLGKIPNDKERKLMVETYAKLDNIFAKIKNHHKTLDKRDHVLLDDTLAPERREEYIQFYFAMCKQEIVDISEGMGKIISFVDSLERFLSRPAYPKRGTWICRFFYDFFFIHR